MYANRLNLEALLIAISFIFDGLYFFRAIWRSSLDPILEWWMNQCRSVWEEDFWLKSLRRSSHEIKHDTGLRFHELQFLTMLSSRKGCWIWVPSWLRSNTVSDECDSKSRCWLFEAFRTVPFLAVHAGVFSRLEWIISTSLVLSFILVSSLNMLQKSCSSLWRSSISITQIPFYWRSFSCLVLIISYHMV